MPDSAGNIKGIALSGKAGETLEKIKRQAKECSYPKCACEGHPDDCPLVRIREGRVKVKPPRECEWHPGVEATHEISGEPACEDCWEKAYNLD